MPNRLAVLFGSFSPSLNRCNLCNKGRSSCFLSKFLGHINPVGMKCLFYRCSFADAYSSVGAQCISRLCFAPPELGLFCDRCSYKHFAPMELTRLVAAPPRCVICGRFSYQRIDKQLSPPSIF